MVRIAVVVCVAVAIIAGGMVPARAQGGPDAWTVYELNLRAGPGGSHPVLAVLPPGTPLIGEARSADSSWLLVRTEDGARRGWVAAAYLEYAPGVVVARLPVSETTAGEAPPADAAPVEGDPPAQAVLDTPPNGALEGMELIYDSGHSQYYRITYWSDGLRVTGFLGYPIGQGPFPVIIYNRGGSWNQGALSGRELVPLVEAGYVAVGSQYRGNAGSEGGETFGAGDVNDALNLIPLVAQMPAVDAGRIGMLGYSRGGMVTYMALKEDTLRGSGAIKAAVTVGGLADLFLWRNDRPEIAYAAYLALVGARPEEAPDLFKARSAVFWPELINAPLLLLHGGDDAEISADHSRALAGHLQQAGKTVQLTIYEGGDHALNGQLGGLPAALDWFQKYFGWDGANRTFDAHWDDIQAVNQWFWQNGYY
jgi:dienelactone hydrolase